MSVELNTSVWTRIPLFAGLAEDERRLLADMADEVAFKAGELVLKQGGRKPAIWILLEGKCDVVRVLDGVNGSAESMVLATLEPYSNFGEMSFFHDAPHSANVRAATDVKLVRLDRVKFNELVKGHSHVACKLTLNTIGSLAERLRRMDEWVVELAQAGKKSARVAEWSQLREKLFDSWTL